MKKIISILLAALMATALVACNTKKEESKPPKNDEVQKEEITVYEDIDLVAIADSLYEGIPEDNKPMTMSMPLDAEMFENFAFIPYEEGFEAVVNEPMIGSIPHSIVLVKCADAETAKRVATDMEAKCNPRKWICVTADTVKSATNKNLAMLLMTTAEGGMADVVLNNFKKFDGKVATPNVDVEVEPKIESEVEPEEDVVAEDESYDATYEEFVAAYAESVESSSGGTCKGFVERDSTTMKLVGQYIIEVDESAIEEMEKMFVEVFTDEEKARMRDSVLAVFPEIENVIVEYRTADGTTICLIEC